MSFLKKLGMILAKGVEVIIGLEPIIAQIYPGAMGATSIVVSELTQMEQIIVNIETIGVALGTAGPDKLKMAAPLVAQVLLKSYALTNHSIADPVLFQQATVEFAQATVDFLNSLKADNIQTANKT